jgi:ubiquinol-cytochrome c reductase iron-sulfur subunit
VDLAPIEPGQVVTVTWRGHPVVVRHRPREEFARARSVRVSGLHDRYARNAALAALAPASDENRTINPEWLVIIGFCTHMGCVLSLRHQFVRDSDAEGWFCRCHAARFDLAGRVIGGPRPH